MSARSSLNQRNAGGHRAPLQDIPAPAGSTAQIPSLLIDEEFQTGFAVFRQSCAGLLHTAKWHRRFFVTGVYIDMRQSRLDAVDVLPRVRNVLRVDRGRQTVDRIVCE